MEKFILLFKVSQFIILFIFVIFISGFQKKREMAPLINEKLILAVKLSYLVPVLIYAYTLTILDKILLFDFIALVLTLLGMILVVKAKIDLQEYHTWAGYNLKTAKLVTKGIYSFIRHPLYLGIFIFMFGGFFFTIIPHAPLFLTLIVFVTLVFITSFLLVVAKKETKFLAKKIGRKFLEYQKKVHPFLPLGKFKE